MLMPRHNVQEVGQLDPENVAEGEEFGSGFQVEVVGSYRSEVGVWGRLRHVSAELTPERAAVVHRSRQASPCSV